MYVCSHEHDHNNIDMEYYMLLFIFFHNEMWVWGGVVGGVEVAWNSNVTYRSSSVIKWNNYDFFFSKIKNILPLVIYRKVITVTTYKVRRYKVFFPKPFLCKTMVEETNLCTPTLRKLFSNYNLIPRDIARYPYP